ncbi:uncharacterized protein [Temnothorax longispinosus]|uniref:uncharacterized protein n=1 Tax=Temnothorax longispinosus TaxID=300112 RepID=UPI003A993DD3
MASMGAPGNKNPLDVINVTPYCLKIHGQYHHLTTTAMRPGDGQAPRYAQLYFLDTEEAVYHRMKNKANQGCDSALMRDLSCFMVQCNEFAKTFKMMSQVEQDLNPKGTKAPNLMLSFRNNPQHDQRRYNAPRANEIAVVFQNIDELKSHNPKYPGFKITQMDYYAHLLVPRAEFSQFQKAGLMDHLDNRLQNEGITAGVPVILPSSFMGSPRNMQERYQDAMSLVRKFGKPDIFITMTCNPQCPEIKENLDGCPVEYRPDLVAKTFSLDVKEVLKDIVQNRILGNVIAYAGVIEFQKRGLPHLHLLAMLSDEDKPRLQEVIDMMVWAEIPDEEKYPELNAKVLKHMIHGPCGDFSRKYPCTGDDGKCSKGFPKEFRDETNANLGIENSRIRKNINGEWIIEIPGEDGTSKADTLVKKLREVLDPAAIRVNRPTTMGEMRLWNLDDSITPGEITNVISVMGDCHESEIKLGTIRRMTNGLHSVWAKCPLIAATKVASSGRLKIDVDPAIIRLDNVKQTLAASYARTPVGRTNTDWAPPVDAQRGTRLLEVGL